MLQDRIKVHQAHLQQAKESAQEQSETSEVEVGPQNKLPQLHLNADGLEALARLRAQREVQQQ